MWPLAALAAVLSFGAFLAWHVAHRRIEPRLDRAQLVILSGRASPRRTASGIEERWQKSHVTVSIDDSVDKLGPAARQAVESAFGSWLTSGADVPALAFDSTSGTRILERPDGRNSVVFAPIDLPGHRNDLALTLTFTDPDTGEILEADLVINARHRFGVLDTNAPEATGHSRDDEQGKQASCGGPRAVKCGGRYDLGSVATHEVGHFLGLGEDQTDACATMYRSTGRCEVEKRTLSSDDRRAMKQLYVAGFADRASTSSGCSIAARPARDSAGLLGLALVALAAPFRRRRKCRRLAAGG